MGQVRRCWRRAERGPHGGVLEAGGRALLGQGWVEDGRRLPGGEGPRGRAVRVSRTGDQVQAASKKKQWLMAIKASYLVKGFVLHRSPCKGHRASPETPVAGFSQPPTCSHTQTPCTQPRVHSGTPGRPPREVERVSGATGAKDGGWDRLPAVSPTWPFLRVSSVHSVKSACKFSA